LENIPNLLEDKSNENVSDSPEIQSSSDSSVQEKRGKRVGLKRARQCLWKICSWNENF